jgi:hypothetical protein
MAARVLSSTVQRMPEPIVHAAHERPDVEVLWEGTWCGGELRMQTQDAAGQWHCLVQYRRPGELSSHLDEFSASNVRADTRPRP